MNSVFLQVITFFFVGFLPSHVEGSERCALFELPEAIQ